MKKFAFCLAACLSCLSLTTKAQTVSVADIDIEPGEKAYFTISLTGGKAKTYTSFQYNLILPEGFKTTGKYTINTTEWPSASSTVGDVDDTGLAVVPANSSEAIISSDVPDLMTVEIFADESVKLGNYTAKLSDLTFGYGMSDKDIASDIEFTISVIKRTVVELDENATTDPTAASGVNALVKRTIKANEWSTICLPFDMTGDQVKEAFGDDVMLAELSEWSFEGDASNVTSATLKFANVAVANGLVANYPYMIKVNNAIESFEAKNVNIAPEDVSIEKEFKVGSGRNAKTYKLSVYGYYKVTDLYENDFFVSENQLWYNDAEGGIQIKGFRNNFTFPSDITLGFLSSGARITMEFGDGTTDAIINAKSIIQNDEYYNLRGQRVDTPAKGIYIKNGKKVVVK